MSGQFESSKKHDTIVVDGENPAKKAKLRKKKKNARNVSKQHYNSMPGLNHSIDEIKQSYSSSGEEDVEVTE